MTGKERRKQGNENCMSYMFDAIRTENMIQGTSDSRKDPVDEGKPLSIEQSCMLFREGALGMALTL